MWWIWFVFVDYQVSVWSALSSIIGTFSPHHITPDTSDTSGSVEQGYKVKVHTWRSDIDTLFAWPVSFDAIGRTPLLCSHLQWENTANTSLNIIYMQLEQHLHNSRPPGTHYCWVGRGSKEQEVWLSHLHNTIGGNWTPDPLILSEVHFPLTHMVLGTCTEGIRGLTLNDKPQISFHWVQFCHSIRPNSSWGFFSFVLAKATEKILSFWWEWSPGIGPYTIVSDWCWLSIKTVVSKCH